MYPYWCLSLWPRCRHNYPVLFLPKLRQDKTTILDSRLTDYTIPTLTFPTHEQSRAAQSNANLPPYDDDDQDKQDKMPYDDLLTFSVPDTWRCCMLVIDTDAFRRCRPDKRVIISDDLWDFTTYFHARAHDRHPSDIKMVPPRIELGS